MKPVTPVSTPATESRPAVAAKALVIGESAAPTSQDSVVTSVTPAIQNAEQAEAALLRIQSALSPLGARAIDAFNPTDVARIEKLLSDE